MSTPLEYDPNIEEIVWVKTNNATDIIIASMSKSTLGNMCARDPNDTAIPQQYNPAKHDLIFVPHDHSASKMCAVVKDVTWREDGYVVLRQKVSQIASMGQNDDEAPAVDSVRKLGTKASRSVAFASSSLGDEEPQKHGDEEDHRILTCPRRKLAYLRSRSAQRVARCRFR